MRTHRFFLAPATLLVLTGTTLSQINSTVRFFSPTYSISETAETVTIGVERVPTSLSQTTLTFTVSSGTNFYGSAIIGADLLGGSGSLTFEPGEIEKSFVLTILDDSLMEGDETATLLLKDSAGLVLAAATLTIHDDESQSGSIDPDFTPPKIEAPGWDPDYGANGVTKITVQPDGRILLGGSFRSVNDHSRNGIARLNSDGSLDATFDPGSGFTNSARGLYVTAITLQPDTRILIGGQFSKINGFNMPGLVRLNSDGTVDPSFQARLRSSTTFGPFVSALTLAPDGKILIGGYFHSVNGVRRLGIARLNSDGSLDSSFDTGARDLNSVSALLVLPDGKTLVGGSVSATGAPRLVRLNEDGSPDASFTISLNPTYSQVVDLALQANGKILVAGYFKTVNGIAQSGIARLNSDGSLDASFAVRLRSGPDPGVLDALIVSETSGILIGGYFSHVNDVFSPNVAWLHEDGTLDTGFSFPGYSENSGTVALQPDGNLLAVATRFSTPYPSLYRFRTSRVPSAQQVDFAFAEQAIAEDARNAKIRIVRHGTFDTAGQIQFRTEDGTAKAELNYVALRETLEFAPGEVSKTVLIPILDNGSVDGDRTLRLLLSNRSGILEVGSQSAATLTIRDNEKKPVLVDPTFIPQIPTNGITSSLWVEPDGRIVLSGYFGAETTSIRLNPDGTLDASFTPTERYSPFPDLIFPPEMSTDWRWSPPSNVIIPLPSGKFIITNPFLNERFGLGGFARLNGDGSLDTTFEAPFNSETFVRAVLLQPDHKMIIGSGTFFSGPNSVPFPKLARLNADGTLDPTFYVPPAAQPNLLRLIQQLAFQSDGRIIVSESSEVYSDALWRLSRRRSDGRLDTTFRPPKVFSGDYFMRMQALLVDQRDRLILVGRFPRLDGGFEYVLRLNPDGSRDETFQVQLDPVDNLGIWEDVYSRASSAVLDPSGNLVIAGAFRAVNGTPRTGMVRILSDSPPESKSIGFSHWSELASENAGFAKLSVERFGATGGAASVSYQTQDGSARSGTDFEGQTNVLQFLPFEQRKVMTIPLQNNRVAQADRAFSVRLANPSEGLTLAGGDSASVTILDDDRPGGLDLSFDTGRSGQLYRGVGIIAVQSDGKLLIATHGWENGIWKDALMLLNIDGSRDETFFWNGRSVPNEVLQPGLVQSNRTFTVSLNTDGTESEMFDSGSTAISDYSYPFGFAPDGALFIRGSILTADGAVHAGIFRLNGYPLVPRLQSVQRLGPLFRTTINSKAGHDYILDGSADFRVWSPLQTNTAAGPLHIFEDRSAASLAHRFYRVRRLD